MWLSLESQAEVECNSIFYRKHNVVIESSVYSEVTDFLTPQRRKWYQELLRVVRSECEKVEKQLGSNCVVRVYGRDDKQKGDFFKAEVKIAEKVSRNRRNNERYAPQNVTDIVGVTLVAQYPDQIPKIIECLVSELANHHVVKIKSEIIERPGYFATHLDVTSENPAFPDVCCEVQIKTMLHDALSTKMHDLNYKPEGELDERLDSLMKTLATSLEAIEVQSQTIRDLISEKWNVDASWRRAASLEMFNILRTARKRSDFFDKKVLSVLDFIETNRSELSEGTTGNYTFDQAIKRTRKLALDDLRTGWLLSAYLGLISKDRDALTFGIVRVQDWISVCLRDVAQGEFKGDYSEVWFGPLALMALSETSIAIEKSYEIISKCNDMPQVDMEITKFNLANFLIEREYALRSKPTQREAVKAEILALVDGCTTLEKSDPSPFYDLRGMILVAFSDKPSDVSEGIKLIELGKTRAPKEDSELADTFYQLHTRLAWRRLLQLEDLDSRH